MTEHAPLEEDEIGEEGEDVETGGDPPKLHPKKARNRQNFSWKQVCPILPSLAPGTE